MRVGILSQWYSPEPGPAAVPAVLARALVARGHQVDVVTGFPNYPTGRVFPGYHLSRHHDEQQDGVSLRRVALYPSHDRSTLRRAANYASFALSASASGLDVLRKADAVWVYNSPATVGLPSWLASRSGGPPHLMHVMDLWPDSIAFSGFASGRSYASMAWPLDRWCRFTYSRACAIAGISQGIVDELAQRGVAREKLHYVPVWADEEAFSPRQPDPKLAREMEVEGCFTMVYAGNLGGAQGLERLLTVCSRLRDLAEFRLLIAGTGTEELRLRRLAADLALSNVRFLGRRPAHEIPGLLSIADVSIVCLNNDPLSAVTMPSKLPSLLASSVPVLAVATGEVARLIEAAGCGWSVPPGDVDQLERTMRSVVAGGKDAARTVGAAGRRHYEARLSLRRGVDAIEGLLKDIAGGTPSGASVTMTDHGVASS